MSEVEFERREPAETISDSHSIYCPHCGLDQGDHPENFVRFSRDSKEYKCDECEEHFSISKDVVITYTTHREDKNVRKYWVDLKTGKKIYEDEIDN